MERLSFAEEGTYSGLEASIHIARYALARDVCRGRKVLDLACGEGYGSRLMLDWGATDVVGIDVSEETVANARARFGRDGLRYLSGDAEKVEALLAGEQFDLIISLETIEHLQNPAAYLKALTRLRAPDGEIFISCPNDWWYYPKAEQSNPYHIRKYSYDEFLALVTPVLGEPDAIALGLPVTGFINVPMKDIGPADARISQIAMMAAGESRNALVVPVEPGSVAPGNSSYFVARWGRGGDAIAGAGILPVPMDVFRNGLYSGDFNRDVRNSAVLGGGLELVRQLQTGLQQQWGAADRSGAALQLKLDELMSATRGEWQRCLEVALQAKEADCQARLTSLSDDCERVASAREKAVLDLARATQDALQSELDGLVRDRVARNTEIADLKLKLQSERVRQAAVLVENEVVARNAGTLSAEKTELETRLATLQHDLAASVAEVADLKLKLQSERVRQAAILVENDVMGRNAGWLTGERARLEGERAGLEGEKARLEGELAVAAIAAHRYFRLRGMIPAPVVSLGRRLRALVRGGR